LRSAAGAASLFGASVNLQAAPAAVIGILGFQAVRARWS
jgi:hypothetical protein